jgi:hypothetical protein
MSFVEDIRVREECVAAGLGAEIDCPAAIFDTWEICRVCLGEFSPTERYEAREFLLPGRVGRHAFIASVPLAR